MPKSVATMFIALMMLFAPAANAADETPAEEETKVWYEVLDAAFGKYVVGNLALVMFYDVAFWDNHLAPTEAVGVRLDGDLEVMAHDDDLGFLIQKHLKTLPDQLVLRLPEAVSREYTDGTQTLSVEIFNQIEADKLTLVSRLKDGQTWTLAEPTAVPAGPEAADEASRTPVLVEGVLPFPFRVVPATGKVLQDRVTVPEADWPTIAEGSFVRFTSDGSEARVLALTDDGGVEVLLADVLFQKEVENPANAKFPIVVLWLVLGAIFFTLRMSFISLRGFLHAILVTTGRYDDPDDPGEISHFQALSSALSATVGLGNIAGVAIAISAGGPGAIFWMVIAALLGMSSKFVECTLGQMYRIEKPDGTVSGGPMHYLKDGIEEMGIPVLGSVLSVVFALMCIGGSLGGGNMFQANQAYAAVEGVAVSLGTTVPGGGPAFGLVLAFFVGLVIVGGIKRIGAVASMIVPLMCGVYVLAGLFIMVINAEAVPGAMMAIVSEAFSPQAGFGGLLGVLAMGFQRASFSNEAGVGSASIAHSAASTTEPVREGIVALLEPFIDTVCVCSMTGIVVVVTGAYKIEGLDGVAMTANAFGQGISWFPYVLSVAVLLFAFSTMISWSYYGERCVVYLFGDAMKLPYKAVFLLFVVFGSSFKLGNVLDFSDLMILGMAFPNVLGAVLLSGKVKAALDDYWGRYQAGQF
jgi:alanine or glycine:cation symporter, AGCS family